MWPLYKIEFRTGLGFQSSYAYLRSHYMQSMLYLILGVRWYWISLYFDCLWACLFLKRRLEERNRVILINALPVPLWQPQTPHGMPWDWVPASAVGYCEWLPEMWRCQNYCLNPEINNNNNNNNNLTQSVFINMQPISTNSLYKSSTKTQIKHKRSTKAQKQSTKQA
jgi:hypothetical protein